MNSWFAGHEILIQTTVVYAFVALSLQVVLRAGVFSLASIAFFGLAGYGAANLTIDGMNAWLALLVVVFACALIAVVLSYVVGALRTVYLAMVTVALTLIISVVARNGGELTGGSLGLFGIPGQISTAGMIALLAVTIIVLRRLELSSIGRSFEALRQNEDLALSVGIDVARRRRFVFCVSAVLGAIGGVLNVYVFAIINPETASFSLTTLGLSMAILGGIARWPGAVIGAIIVAWLPELLGGVTEYEPVIYGVVVVILVVLAPSGIVGLYDGLIRRIRERRARARADAGDSPDEGSTPAAGVATQVAEEKLS